MTSALSDRLRRIHDRFGDDPLPERFEEASCGPHAKHLAHLAMHAADAGGTRDEWLSWVRRHVPEASPTLIVEAEECMRSSGTWPWNNPTTPISKPD